MDSRSSHHSSSKDGVAELLSAQTLQAPIGPGGGGFIQGGSPLQVNGVQPTSSCTSEAGARPPRCALPA